MIIGDSLTSDMMGGNNAGFGGENGGKWGYDQNTDPVWDAYLKQYTRAADKSMNDALAQLSARTGGLASSYAGQVAQQTHNDVMQGATDMIPKLYEAAYGRWMDEQEMARADDETAYRRQQDALDRQLAADQTAWERQAYQNELAADQQSQGMELLLSMMGIGYRPTSEELSRYGLNQGMADATYGDYLRGITPKTSSGGSGDGDDGNLLTSSAFLNLVKNGYVPTAEEMARYGLNDAMVQILQKELATQGQNEGVSDDDVYSPEIDAELGSQMERIKSILSFTNGKDEVSEASAQKAADFAEMIWEQLGDDQRKMLRKWFEDAGWAIDW